MEISKLIESKKESKSQNFPINLYKGACVKIKNSRKTFQVIGINPDNKICWVREWPFSFKAKKTFALEISQITIKIFCSNLLSE
tara:strand:- start:169 stop:420 length:252 start_codon:yes stop_codon:yes gene_type:complete